MSDFICAICKECCNSLKKHIKQHNIQEQDYYDIYLKSNEKEGFCSVCKKPTSFKDLYKGYNKYCSKSCLNKSDIHKNSVKTTKYIKYGNSSYNNAKKISESLNNRSKEAIKKSVLKSKQTRKERYGDENYNNSDKYKQTCLKIYGTECPFTNEQIKKQINDKWNTKSKEEQAKIIQTRKNTINAKSDEEKQIINQKHKDAYNNKSDLEKQQINQKRNNTKRKNHSFKTSKIEDTCYIILKEIYNDVIRSYSTEKYPYNCDFYIPSKDMYIECNFHWTHGYMKYDGRKTFCKQQLQKWKERAKTSKYFENAIYTWTVRDVQKFKIAKQNKLNYLVFYNYHDFDEYIKSIMQ